MMSLHRHLWRGRLGDFTAAFLNALVDEEVLVRPPRVVQYKSPTLWRLQKALYGLRQAPALRHQCLAKIIADIGLLQLLSDSSLYHGKDSIVFVHVDDLLAVGPGSQIEWLFDQIQLRAELRAEAWPGEEPAEFIGKWIQYTGKEVMIWHDEKYLRGIGRALGLECEL